MTTGGVPPGLRRDAARNYERIIAAAREVLDECGPDAGMEQIAARAGVGVGTVYRRFPSKEALIDELVRLVIDDLVAAAEQALARGDGTGLEAVVHEIGKRFVDHRRYAGLMMPRGASDESSRRLRARLAELTDDARSAGTVNPDTTLGDILALIWSLRGLIQATSDIAPDAWMRHLDIHLAGLRSSSPLSTTPPITAKQLARPAPGPADGHGGRAGSRRRNERWDPPSTSVEQPAVTGLRSMSDPSGEQGPR